MTVIIYDIANTVFGVLMDLLFLDGFLNRRNFKRGLVLVVSILWMVSECITNYLMDDMYIAKLIVLVLGGTLSGLILFKAKLWQYPLLQIFYLGIYCAAEFLVLMVQERITTVDNVGDITANVASYVFGGVVSQLIVFIVGIFVRRFVNKRDFAVLSTGEWLLLMLLPTVTIMLAMGMIYAFDGELDERQQAVIAFVAIGLLAVNIAEYYLIAVIAKKEHTLRQQQLLAQQSQNLLETYSRIAEEREMQKARNHDTIKLLTTAHTMAVSDGNDDLATFLENQLNITESVVDVYNCGNKIINAVINCEYAKAKKKNISVNLILTDLKDIKLPELDIVTICANTLDNAIEAVDKLEGNKRLIRFKMNLSNDVLIISCENAYSGLLKVSNGKLLSLKADKNHGYGLSNIEEIANRHEGRCIVTTDNNIFRIQVLLKK